MYFICEICSQETQFLAAFYQLIFSSFSLMIPTSSPSSVNTSTSTWHSSISQVTFLKVDVRLNHGHHTCIHIKLTISNNISISPATKCSIPFSLAIQRESVATLKTSSPTLPTSSNSFSPEVILFPQNQTSFLCYQVPPTHP